MRLTVSRAEKAEQMPHATARTRPRSARRPETHDLAGRLLQLQRAHGNAYVQRLIQAKLAISQPGDVYEQEADRVAEQVMRMPEPTGAAVSEASELGLQRKCGECAGGKGFCPKCAEGEKVLQRKPVEVVQRVSAGEESEEASSEVEAGVEALRGGGQPLPASVRAFFEPRFGYDFSGVRVHTDAWAAESAQALSALAYTVGQDIVFAPGQYAPMTPAGRSLLAHELTHAVQQSGFASDADGNRIQRTAATCRSGWSTTVSDDHTRALGMISTARGKLSSYNGTTPPEVKTALDRHFKASGTGFAGWVNFNLAFLETVAPLASYDCEDTSSWWCGPTTLAKTFWCVPFVDIRVCEPLYFGQSDRERSGTLIHEWVHKYGCNFDLGYSDSPDYPSQWTITALVNADPFAEFVKDVQ